jgi:hypothetical protein
LYKAKLISSQKTKIERKGYFFNKEPKSYKVIEKTYLPFCLAITDCLLVLLVLLLTMFLNWHYGIYLLFMVFGFTVAMEQWAFSVYQTNLMKKLKIDSKQLIDIAAILLYLVMFLGLIVVVLNTNIALILAILIFLLVRLANGALKSFFIAQIKLRKFYFK